MNTNSTHISKISAIATSTALGAVVFLLIGGNFISLFMIGKPAQAQLINRNFQSRVSVAVTNSLPNGTTNRFTSETVFPENSISPSGQLMVKIKYGSVSNDPSQVGIIEADVNVETVNYTSQTIESAIARAVDAAANSDRFSDIISILRSFQRSGSSALD